MPITVSTPVTQPAVTYNLAAVKCLRIDWVDLNKPVTAQYTLSLYTTQTNTVTNPDGTTTTTTVNVESPGSVIVGGIQDLFTAAATRAAAGKPALATALNDVLTALQEIEHEKGTI